MYYSEVISRDGALKNKLSAKFKFAYINAIYSMHLMTAKEAETCAIYVLNKDMQSETTETFRTLNFEF